MSRLVIPFIMMLQIVGVVGRNSFSGPELFDFLVYCGIMIWFYVEISEIATMRFNWEEEYCGLSVSNWLYFSIIASAYFAGIPVLIYYGYNLLAFMVVICIWSGIGYINNYDFGLNVDNLISRTLVYIFIFNCLDIFKREFMRLEFLGYIIGLFTAVCYAVFVFGNMDNPEFKEDE